jgi:hypothetical protein
VNALDSSGHEPTVLDDRGDFPKSSNCFLHIGLADRFPIITGI